MHFHQIMVGYVVLFQFRFMRGIVGFFLRFEGGMGVLIVDWPKLPECLGGTQNAGDILYSLINLFQFRMNNAVSFSKSSSFAFKSSMVKILFSFRKSVVWETRSISPAIRFRTTVWFFQCCRFSF